MDKITLLQTILLIIIYLTPRRTRPLLEEQISSQRCVYDKTFADQNVEYETNADKHMFRGPEHSRRTNPSRELLLHNGTDFLAIEWSTMITQRILFDCVARENVVMRPLRYFSILYVRSKWFY